MNLLKLTLLIPTLFFAGLSFSEADQIGNGGDTYANEFRVIAQDLVKELREEPVIGIDAELLSRAVEGTKVTSKESLLLDGKSVDAINYPHLNPPEIILSRVGWDRLKLDEYQRTLLTLHEYLWVAGVDDTGFRVSSKIDRASVCGRNPSIRLALEEYFHMPCHRIRTSDLKRIEKLEPSWSVEPWWDKPLPFKAEPLKRTDLKYFDQLSVLKVAVTEVDKDTFEDVLNLTELTLYFDEGFKIIPEGGLSSLARLETLWIENFGKPIGIAPRVHIEASALPSSGNLKGIGSSDIAFHNNSPAISFAPHAFSKPADLERLWLYVSSDYSLAEMLKGIKSIERMNLKIEHSKSLDKAFLAELKRVDMQEFAITTEDPAGVPFGYLDEEVYDKYYCENINHELKCVKPW